MPTPRHTSRSLPRTASRMLALTVCAAFGLASGGCAKTRLGALVPGHVRSQLTKGELVTARYIRLKKGEPDAPALTAKSENSSSKFSAGPLASFAAGIAIDALKEELIREAKSYEHQSSSRLLLSTNDLGSEGLIVVTRWIDGAPAASAEGGDGKAGTSSSRRRGVYPNRNEAPTASELDARFEDQIVDAEGNPVGGGDADAAIALNKILGSQTQSGKRPAAVLTMRVKRVGSAPVYRIAGAQLWVGTVGAKIVNFGWGNLPKFWQWPGALLLKSDSQAEMEFTMNVKSLQQVDQANYKWSEVKPESGVLSSIKVNLNQLPKSFSLGNNVGAWMALPVLPAGGGKGMGFAVLDFKLNERDTSNAQKYIEQAAGALEKNRGSIIDSLSKAVQ